MVLDKRYCVSEVDGTVECFRGDGGFWYTQKGMIIKWSILGALFFLFIGWFLGGYLHAKRRLKAGKPLLAYHRFLISWQVRKRYGQTPQNHFTFYAPGQNPYLHNPAYAQRADGSWPEAPPLYNGADAPPTYFTPQGASKANPQQGMEMGQFGQQSGVVGGGDVEQGLGRDQSREQALPPRPPMKAKAVLKGFTERFRK